MARPALKFQLEDPMEERVAKLEANIEHIRSDVSDIKTDVRRLNDKIDGVNKDLSGKIDAVNKDLSGKIDTVNKDLSGKIDAVNKDLLGKFDTVIQAIADLKIGRALDRVWWLLMSGALLGIMARAFKWI
jgi:predicted  nucleic acid-binding Zn-ribbon protein